MGLFRRLPHAFRCHPQATSEPDPCADLLSIALNPDGTSLVVVAPSTRTSPTRSTTPHASPAACLEICHHHGRASLPALRLTTNRSGRTHRLHCRIPVSSLPEVVRSSAIRGSGRCGDRAPGTVGVVAAGGRHSGRSRETGCQPRTVAGWRRPGDSCRAFDAVVGRGGSHACDRPGGHRRGAVPRQTQRCDGGSGE